MVTALNHVVADGRRAGGLNLSSSILADYRESEAGEGASHPEATAFCFFWRRQRCTSPKKINTLGVLNLYYTDTPPFVQEERESEKAHFTVQGIGKEHSLQTLLYNKSTT